MAVISINSNFAIAEEVGPTNPGLKWQPLGPVACSYYEALCVDSCTLNEYACTAQVCCEDFGSGFTENCIRGCLIDLHERGCRYWLDQEGAYELIDTSGDEDTILDIPDNTNDIIDLLEDSKDSIKIELSEEYKSCVRKEHWACYDRCLGAPLILKIPESCDAAMDAIGGFSPW